MNETRSFTAAAALLCVLAASGTGSALTLRETVERALARSPAVGAAQAGGDEASASARLARDAFHPEAWLTATPGYSSGLPTAIAGRVPAIAGFDVRQTLYDRSARTEVYQSDAKAARERGTAEASRREIARAAVLLYARCWADGVRLGSARRRQAAGETMLARAEALFREGRRTELELERVRLEAARARQRNLDAQSDRDLDFRELRLAVGAEPGSPLDLAEDPFTAFAAAAGPEAGLLRASDPALQALELEIDSLRRAAALAGAGISPVVEAEGQYSRLSRANHYDRYYRSFKADDWSVGLSIAVPLWSGGRAADTRARIESRLAAAEADRRGRLDALDLAAARAGSALDRASAAESLAERAAGVSGEALRVSESLLREGRGEPDEVEKKRIELSDSEEDALRAKLDRVAASCDLLTLSGQIVAPGS